MKGHKLHRQRNSLWFLVTGLLTLMIIVFLPGGNLSLIWPAILVNSIYFIGFGLFAGIFLGMHILADARWIIHIYKLLNRILLLVIATVPGFMILFFGMNSLFPWHADPGINVFKELYFESFFFVFRNIGYFLVWIIMVLIIHRFDINTREISEKGYPVKMKIWSAIFLVFTGVIISPFSWDWLMSIDINWQSTLYGWYVLSGILAGGAAFLIVILWLLRNSFHIWEGNLQTRLNLARYLFAFSNIWMYLWYVQFFLIWYGNIPKETVYYVTRLQDFSLMFFASVILNFVIPFVLLISRKGKMNSYVLLIASFFVLIGQWMDKYLLVVPGTLGHTDWTVVLMFLPGLAMFGISYEMIRGKWFGSGFGTPISK